MSSTLSPSTHTPIASGRELASRDSDGLAVSLLWSKRPTG